MTVGEVPISFVDRVYGESKLGSAQPTTLLSVSLCLLLSLSLSLSLCACVCRYVCLSLSLCMVVSVCVPDTKSYRRSRDRRLFEGAHDALHQDVTRIEGADKQTGQADNVQADRQTDRQRHARTRTREKRPGERG